MKLSKHTRIGVTMDKSHKKHNGQTVEDLGPRSFISEYWPLLSMAFVMFAVTYVLIYLLFQLEGPFSTGKDLSKGDWLVFSSGFLSFCGTILIGLVAVLQNEHYVKGEAERRRAERVRLIKPILTVTIVSRNKRFRLSTGPCSGVDVDYPGSVTIQIANVGNYPISNIVVFDRYICDCLTPGDFYEITCGYDNIPAPISSLRNVLMVSESEYGKSEDGLPEYINVNYLDVDGVEWYQTYSLRCFEEARYYGLDGTYEI